MSDSRNEGETSIRAECVDDVLTWFAELEAWGIVSGSLRTVEWVRLEMSGYPIPSVLPYYRLNLLQSTQLDGFASTDESDKLSAATLQVRTGGECIRRGITEISERLKSGVFNDDKGTPDDNIGVSSTSSGRIGDDLDFKTISAVHGVLIVVRSELGLSMPAKNVRPSKARADRAISSALRPPTSNSAKTTAHRPNGSKWSILGNTIVDFFFAVADFIGKHF